MKRNCTILTLLAFAALLLDAAAEPVIVHRVANPSGYAAWIVEAVATAKYHGARWSAVSALLRLPPCSIP